MKKKAGSVLSFALALFLSLSLLSVVPPQAKAAERLVDPFNLTAHIAPPVAGQSGYRTLDAYTTDQFVTAGGMDNGWFEKERESYSLWDSIAFPDSRFAAHTAYYFGLRCTGKNGYTFNGSDVSSYKLDGISAVGLLSNKEDLGDDIILVFPYPETGDSTASAVISTLSLPAIAPPVTGGITARAYFVGSGQIVDIPDLENGWYTKEADGTYALLGMLDQKYTEYQGTFAPGTTYFLGINLYAHAGYVFSENDLSAYQIGGIPASGIRVYDNGSAAVLYWPFPATAAASGITDVDVTVTPPTEGSTPADSAATADSNCYVAAVSWSPETAGAFDPSTSYTVVLNLETAKAGFVFAKDVNVRVNGKPAAIVSGAGSDSMRVTYAFAPIYPQLSYANILLDAPKAGAVPDVTAQRKHDAVIESGYNFGYTVTKVTWSPSDAVFASGKDYTVFVTIAISEKAAVLSSFFPEINGIDCYAESPAYEGERVYTFQHTFSVDSGSFPDVPPTAYYASPVDWAVKQGITSGTSPTTFSPETACTRAQTVTFLWRAMGSPDPAGKPNPFEDTAAGAYYDKAVQWAVEKGITAGTSPTTFSPDATVTRSQFVTFLWRAAGKPAPAGDPAFSDVSTSSDYYYDAVRWAAGEKITAGTSAATFSPGAACTRGQVVTFLYRQMH